MMKKKFKKVMILLAWLAILEFAAMLVHNSILLVGPTEVMSRLWQLLHTVDFYQICLMSLFRIMVGMTAAFFLGCFFGACMYKWNLFEEIISPVLAVMKSIPVASFVVLLLIWQGSENLSVFISFIVVFPNICVSMKNGLLAVPKEKMEMAKIFGMKGIGKWVYIYRPSVLPFLISCMEISIGMSFKSGVAAEVIGTPDFSIGERIYVSKVYLDTAGLFAWTISLILLSFIVEKGILFLMRKALTPIRYGKNEVQNGKKNKSSLSSDSNHQLVVDNISKSYGEKMVLNHISMQLQKGGRYFLMAPSGSGKTTLLRIIAGLETADEGRIEGNHAVTYMFQEDRLLEEELTITNIAPYTPARNKYLLAAGEILPKDCMRKPASQLSGGMKRRVALLRAMLFQYDNPDAVCLLDEPFSGLDEETKRKVISFIIKYQNGRTMLIASHNEADCELLSGILWKL